MVKIILLALSFLFLVISIATIAFRLGRLESLFRDLKEEIRIIQDFNNL